MAIILIIIISLMVPAFVSALFVLMEVRRKRRVRIGLQRILGVLIEQHHLWFVTIEFFKNKFIGIDKVNKKLVFAEYREGEIVQYCIDLMAVSFCRVTKTIDKHTREVTEIFLQLKSIQEDDAFRLRFYQSIYDDKRARALLLEKAREWKDQINKQINRETYNYLNTGG